jgi:hypothetical protein
LTTGSAGPVHFQSEKRWRTFTFLLIPLKLPLLKFSR